MYVLICCCLVAKSCPTLCDLIDYSPPGSSVQFPRQEYWNGLSFLSPGNFPDLGIESTSPAWAGRFFTSESPGQAYIYMCVCMCVYTHTARFSICLSGDGYLGCFPILAVVNNATLKMRVQLPFLFIYSFLVALGLHCCVQAFCSWGKGVGTTVHCSARAARCNASLVVEHRL